MGQIIECFTFLNDFRVFNLFLNAIILGLIKMYALSFYNIFYIQGRLLSMYNNSVQQRAGPNPELFALMTEETLPTKLSKTGHHGAPAFDEMRIQVLLKFTLNAEIYNNTNH